MVITKHTKLTSEMLDEIPNFIIYTEYKITHFWHAGRRPGFWKMSEWHTWSKQQENHFHAFDEFEEIPSYLLNEVMNWRSIYRGDMDEND